MIIFVTNTCLCNNKDIILILAYCFNMVQYYVKLQVAILSKILNTFDNTNYIPNPIIICIENGELTWAKKRLICGRAVRRKERATHWHSWWLWTSSSDAFISNYHRCSVVNIIIAISETESDFTYFCSFYCILLLVCINHRITCGLYWLHNELQWLHSDKQYWCTVLLNHW